MGEKKEVVPQMCWLSTFENFEESRHRSLDPAPKVLIPRDCCTIPFSVHWSGLVQAFAIQLYLIAPQRHEEKEKEFVQEEKGQVNDKH